MGSLRTHGHPGPRRGRPTGPPCGYRSSGSENARRWARRAGLLLALAWLAPLAGAAPLHGDDRHPTDGPDVDPRIYLDDRQVRMRVRANLAFLDEVADAPREVDDAVAEVEERACALALFEALTEANQVRVDGVELDPVLDDYTVLPAPPGYEENFPLSGAKALVQVQVDYHYPLLAAPTRIAFVWGLFPVDPVYRPVPGVEARRIVVSAQLNAGGYDYPLEFTAEEPEIIWHGELPDEDELFLPVPGAEAPPRPELPGLLLVLGPVGLVAGGLLFRGGRRGAGLLAVTLCLGAGALGRDLWRVPLPGGGPRLPTEAEAVAIFEPMHQNIYRAFGFDDEERIYDALARSVDGELLDALYRQVYRGLVMEEEGGAVSRVQSVRTLDSEVERVGLLEDQRAGFTLRTRWQVDGAVFHYGHAHRRTQEYAARYTVARLDPGDGESAWRIVGNQVLEQSVVSTSPGEEPIDPDSSGAPGVLIQGTREL